jgi:hypothetical protein
MGHGGNTMPLLFMTLVLSLLCFHGHYMIFQIINIPAKSYHLKNSLLNDIHSILTVEIVPVRALKIIP